MRLINNATHSWTGEYIISHCGRLKTPPTGSCHNFSKATQPCAIITLSTTTSICVGISEIWRGPLHWQRVVHTFWTKINNNAGSHCPVHQSVASCSPPKSDQFLDREDCGSWNLVTLWSVWIFFVVVLKLKVQVSNLEWFIIVQFVLWRDLLVH